MLSVARTAARPARSRRAVIQERIAFKELTPAVSRLELELNGAARRARVTGATVAGWRLLAVSALEALPVLAESAEGHPTTESG
ncbi:hypothetical protein DV515_00009654 [Chloebia gouldiae]|uniref:Uncharacterized protein n=1 Tax=Chloebia gouldiae TaxID=44316 RepID=A0A3L8SB30_CHLGU|nr:hypothetical protein DV515_00009654 [Chloebia gouldiae]